MTLPPHWTANQALRALQNHGIVSDLCLTLEDVALRDVERAEKWLLCHLPDGN